MSITFIIIYLVGAVLSTIFLDWLSEGELLSPFDLVSITLISFWPMPLVVVLFLYLWGD